MPNEAGVYSRETAELILEVVNYLQRAGFVPRKGLQRPPIIEGDAILIRNDASTELPRYGCLQVTGTVEVEGINYFTADQPTDVSGEAGPYLFNLHTAIPAGEYGIASAGPLVHALADTASPSAGENYGPQVGEWEVTLTAGGILNVCGTDDIDTNVIRAICKGGGGGGTYIFKTPTGGIPARSVDTPGNAACTPYQINASGDLEEILDAQEQSQTLTVYHIGGSAVEEDVYIQAKTVNGSIVVDMEDCE
ncbi:MAG: hypothetical protein HKN35_15835 [Woeseia sp.]|nr:hypothetical protein [Woeseia sp.]